LKEKHKVALLCKVLGIPRSTYYSFRYKKPSKTAVAREILKQEITSLYEGSDGIYGAPKIHKELVKKYNISIKRVQRIMSELGLKSVIIKKFKHHTTATKVDDRDNLLNQDFSTATINEKWVGDITYIHTIKDGWCYLASVMDLHTKKIVGFAFDKNMTTDLIIRALDNAIKSQSPDEGLIFHSDLGSQYTSEEFSNYTFKNKIIQSFSKKGCPYDNACIESFHAILKKEEVYRFKYIDFDVARLRLFKYIESWYNRKRIHGSMMLV